MKYEPTVHRVFFGGPGKALKDAILGPSKIPPLGIISCFMGRNMKSFKALEKLKHQCLFNMVRYKETILLPLLSLSGPKLSVSIFRLSVKDLKDISKVITNHEQLNEICRLEPPVFF